MSVTLSYNWMIQLMMRPHPHNLTTIEQPQGTINTPQFKAANTPVRMKDKETDFYDTEQHTYEVV